MSPLKKVAICDFKGNANAKLTVIAKYKNVYLDFNKANLHFKVVYETKETKTAKINPVHKHFKKGDWSSTKYSTNCCEF